MPLHVHMSNRAERLVEALAGVVSAPLSDPLAPETILVQSKGMVRWLQRELARRMRPPVFANGKFLFPNAFVGQVAEKLLDPDPGRALFTREALTFRILALLPGLLDSPGFEILRTYLAEDETQGREPLKGYQLASRIADVFDQYALFRPSAPGRPGLLDRFAAGEDPRGENRWQGPLWRALAKGNEGAHRGALLDALRARLRRGRLPEGVVPERLCVFGIPSLPPYHLEALLAIASAAELHLFLLNPSGEYWEDTVSDREMVRVEARSRRRGLPVEEQHYATAHPLLGSMGKLGRDFLRALGKAEAPWELEEHFDPPAGDSLLARLQSDIFRLVTRGDAPGASRAARTGERLPVEEGDRSIRVHSVHGPMREMEVLHDQLLDLFDGDPTLEPEDVVVMAPDIEAYAPYVAAVFGGRKGGTIPYRVADRPGKETNEAARALLSIFRLHRGRFAVGEVMEVLESDAVCRRFRIPPERRGQLARWVEETAVRWGVDGEDRKRFDLPPFEENGWRRGIDRLLAGYAMQGDGVALHGGLLPHGGVEGSDASLLGAFVDFLEALFSYVRGLEEPRTLAAWSRDLRLLLDAFTGSDGEDGQGAAELREQIGRLAELASAVSFTEAVEFEVVRAFLERCLSEERPALGFLSGGVTFCEILPMRGIPFRVVALVGMDSGVFPRQDRPPGFDLLAKEPRDGDRSFREEDRYLFLEALLSARDCFYLSYRGQSRSDNSALPPSVVVSELLDCLDQGWFVRRAACGEEAELPAGEALVVRHRLQPFHPEYFSGDGPLFSYSRENREAVEGRVAAAPSPFLAAPLPGRDGSPGRVSLRELKSFLRSPAEALLRERLGIHLPWEEPAPREEEPFTLGTLERHGLRAAVAARGLEGRPLSAQRPALLASGLLPVGIRGEALLSRTEEEVGAFVLRVTEACREAPLPPVAVDLPLSGRRLVGTVGGAITPAALVRYRCGRLRGKDRLDAWVDHLALAACAVKGYPVATRLFALDEAVTLPPVEDPASILEALLDLFLERRGERLPLLPKSSWAYASELEKRRRKLRKSPPPEEELAAAVAAAEEGAMKAALDEWEGRPFPLPGMPGEKDDPWQRLAFRDAPPPVGPGEFAALAERVYGPVARAAVADRGRRDGDGGGEP